MMLRIAVLLGSAVGVCSAFFFLSLMLGAGVYAPLLASLMVVGALAWWVRLPAGEPSPAPNRWVAVLFFAALAAALAAFVMLGWKEPHGDWDAWAIYNLHARFLVRGGAHWTLMFSMPLTWSFPDYPLLLPAFVAQVWSVLKSESTIVPAAVAFLFTFAAVAVVIAAVRRFRGWNEALIAGAVLLGCTDHLVVGATQFADIPLAFYIALCLALLAFEDPKPTILAGAMAGFAAWTKNEGLWFLVAMIVARMIARWRTATLPRMTRELGQISIGAAPILAVLAIFKFRYAPPNQLLFGHTSGEVLAHALDFGRYVMVIEAYVKAIYHAGEMLLPAVLVLAAYAWLVRFKVEPAARLALTTLVAGAVLMLAGELAVYVLFPNDLLALINTSVSRVFTQIWPMALIGFFWAASRVELNAASKPAGKAAATRRR